MQQKKTNKKTKGITMFDDSETIESLFSAGAASQVKAVINLNQRVNEVEDLLDGSPMTLDNKEFRRRVEAEVIYALEETIELKDSLDHTEVFGWIEADVRSACEEEIENMIDDDFLMESPLGEKVAHLEEQVEGLMSVLGDLSNGLSEIFKSPPTFKERRNKSVGGMLDKLNEHGQTQVMLFIEARIEHQRAQEVSNG
jgi:hypothetical protein